MLTHLVQYTSFLLGGGEDRDRVSQRGGSPIIFVLASSVVAVVPVSTLEYLSLCTQKASFCTERASSFCTD